MSERLKELAFLEVAVLKAAERWLKAYEGTSFAAMKEANAELRDAVAKYRGKPAGNPTPKE